ncbi:MULTISPECIES: class I SAM-dependent methyltransferase [Streptomyces]|uniref:Class I SAM-dependent methyltransferase n=1 Tax=Streptomyces tsukubensis (strain DSM 42081 / NBRC 108919 / NRRL 18488 / 9993) TaxID=1114943 RepID=I2N5A8_STRT9|nr:MULTISPECIES: class I SAM-dependent methyltransferase [Streptomyces]AZK96230.1 SAM-dependent methyltransferase [Streptomyces tsukubensis]EIF92205.1 type 11 methyltransferase [Streptomyces tsukubensis NRRL18488]MYS67395.1 methyltransferase domain-containing protein [Streptomyces sp. SID5473]QKM67760.1 class I SAM-dependent methyltransferase [Streptomyces tsukubensis NRRL18488]TAI44155.1 class I SAM-dependent methyltransferase [Streptomyces tsukubensis]
MYGQELAEVYEIFYRSRGKDWPAEAAYVTELVRTRCPEADSLLDVACGTGAHLETFEALFKHTEGLEIADPMRELAHQRLPDVTVHPGDMRAFDLGRTFDAVVCMFCAIGYLGTVSDMRDAVRSMAGHLRPGGVLVIEPWWFPEDHVEGYVAGDLGRENGRTVARISHSTLQGRATRMEVRFLVGDRDGIKEFTEVDVLTLFTKDEYLAAFTDAGCTVEYLPGDPTGRGLFVGVRQ